jgi:hypothetical protein
MCCIYICGYENRLSLFIIYPFPIVELQSPVHDAARAGSEKCLRLLKDAGANMYLKTGNGSTALHYAAQAS